MITHCQSTIVISASKVSDLSDRYADLSKHTFSLSHLLKKIRLEEFRKRFEVIWISVEELFMELSKKYWERYSNPLVLLLIHHAR